MKFLKTIRFDPSDLQVFEIAAAQDEWAIPGGFLFADFKDGDFKGKQKQAFSNGFLSVESFGFSTFASVWQASDEELQNVNGMLAQYFVDNLGAPSLDEALLVAGDEVQFVCDMCSEIQVNSIVALSRYFDDDGELREEFRIVKAPQEAQHARVWEVISE